MNMKKKLDRGLFVRLISYKTIIMEKSKVSAIVNAKRLGKNWLKITSWRVKGK